MFYKGKKLTEKETFSKIADRVVMQVIENMGFELDEAQMKRLLQNKADRAQAMIDARKNVPAFHIDY